MRTADRLTLSRIHDYGFLKNRGSTVTSGTDGGTWERGITIDLFDRECALRSTRDPVPRGTAGQSTSTGSSLGPLPPAQTLAVLGYHGESEARCADAMAQVDPSPLDWRFFDA